MGGGEGEKGGKRWGGGGTTKCKGREKAEKIMWKLELKK